MNDAEVISKYSSTMNELLDEHKKQIQIHKCHTCGKPSGEELYILPNHIYLCEDCRPSGIHGISKASFALYGKNKETSKI
jgi:ribosomal protein L37AE/L43A